MDEIILQIQQGHSELYEQLWLSVKDLVTWWAHRYYRAITTSGTALGGVEVEDLIQAGYLALVAAVNGYDSSKGSFTTYLGYHIKKEYRLAIGRSYRQLHDPLNWCRSYDEPIHKDEPEGQTKCDFIPDPVDRISEVDERVFLEQLHDALEAALDTLPPQQAQAIRFEYYGECTLGQIADRMGLSTSERARQLRNTGFQRIRNSSAGKKLEQFLDENTSFYKGMSLKSFNQTKTSGVEQWVIRREQLRKSFERLCIDDGSG